MSSTVLSGQLQHQTALAWVIHQSKQCLRMISVLYNSVNVIRRYSPHSCE